jgi:hypothetical protein
VTNAQAVAGSAGEIESGRVSVRQCSTDHGGDPLREIPLVRPS